MNWKDQLHSASVTVIVDALAYRLDSSRDGRLPRCNSLNYVFYHSSTISTGICIVSSCCFVNLHIAVMHSLTVY